MGRVHEGPAAERIKYQIQEERCGDIKDTMFKCNVGYFLFYWALGVNFKINLGQFLHSSVQVFPPPGHMKIHCSVIASSFPLILKQLTVAILAYPL